MAEIISFESLRKKNTEKKLAKLKRMKKTLDALENLKKGKEEKHKESVIGHKTVGASQAIQPRILITDDEPSILSVCRDYFRNEGYEVYTALNAEEALEFLSEESVDVVITDINKPGMRGWELTEIIKRKYDAEVIILTGYRQKGDPEKARRIGAFKFLSKPVKLTDLLNSVKKALNSHLSTSQGSKEGWIAQLDRLNSQPHHLHAAKLLQKMKVTPQRHLLHMFQLLEEMIDTKKIVPADHLESLFYAIKDGDPDKLDSFLNWEEGVVLMDTPLAQGEELLEELNSQHQERNLLM